MGCDIHAYVERQDLGGTWVRVDWPGADGEPFSSRNYSVFSFLADVRNYSEVPPLAEPRGLPDDVSDDVRREWREWNEDGHSCSWFTVDELAEFNYEDVFENRRVIVGGNGTVTAERGGGKVVTYREFLSRAYFEDLATLTALRQVNQQGQTRVVFWFDS